jgi:uncharacterized membrane protein YgdD (TMEM256/DUF423 family)
MKNIFLFIAGLLGATGVAFGALGAHALKMKMQEGLITADQLGAFETATKYQLFHALALLVVYFMNRDKQFRLLTVASYLFVTGIVLFSGSLYLLTTRNITGINAVSFLGPITPLGGVALIAGWVCLSLQAFRLNKH